MKRLNWVLYGALSLGIGFLALHPGFVKNAKAQSEFGRFSKRCDNATLQGTYEYSYTGFTGTGGSATHFAVAGLVVFEGDGNEHGVATTTTEGQPLASFVTFTGKYNVNPNCSVTETDTDQNGVVTHFDDFTGPGGATISYVETDPDVVTSGSETRVSTSERTSPE
jgi:hypothetical protein